MIHIDLDDDAFKGLKTLNDMEHKFLMHYIASRKPEDAAMNAGYRQPKHGYKLVKRLSEHIGRLDVKTVSHFIAQRTEREYELTKIMRDSKIPVNQKLKAIELLSKLQGDFAEANTVKIAPVQIVDDLFDDED